MMQQSPYRRGLSDPVFTSMHFFKQNASKFPGERQPHTRAWSKGLEASPHRAALTGTPAAQKPRKGLGMFLEDKLGHQPARDIHCLQEHLLSPGKFRRIKKKVRSMGADRAYAEKSESGL